jgi:hypothetical protein
LNLSVADVALQGCQHRHAVLPGDEPSQWFVMKMKKRAGIRSSDDPLM